MFYEIGGPVRQIQADEIGEGKIAAGIVTVPELTALADTLKISETVLESVGAAAGKKHRLQNALMVFDDYSFGLLHVMNEKKLQGKQDLIGAVITSRLFLVIDIEDQDKSTAGALERALRIAAAHPERATLERLIYGFLSGLIANEPGNLMDLEKRIDKLDKQAESGKAPHFREELASIRRELLIQHNYFEELIDFGEVLIENSNEIFEEENLRYFSLFTGRVSRLSGNTQMLREYVSQVREAYQAAQDYELNRVMKVFTVVTTVFFPLTLIAGWYGMNFKGMPELDWKYGYPAVILLSILVVAICIYWFHKKKLM